MAVKAVIYVVLVSGVCVWQTMDREAAYRMAGQYGSQGIVASR